MPYDFDTVIDRRHTNCSKWDMLETLYGADPAETLAMWVADMDFAAPPCVNQTLRNLADHGPHGYFGDDRAYKQSIVHWMASRHDWTVAPEWITTVHGLVSGIGLALQTFTQPGDGVILFTPVYHAFHRIIKANDRAIVESRLVERDGRYVMDLDALADRLTGNEKVVILCSPHNPGGRVWSEKELKDLARFCTDHDLLLFSDEVHHDLVYPGHRHIVMQNAAPEITDRLVMFTAASKTFNLAGALTGNVILPDAALRARYQRTLAACGIHAHRLGAMVTTAAYAHGAEWLDELLVYLDGNRRVFDDGIRSIPGLSSMKLEATYLSWVDFSGTGMEPAEIVRRVQEDARIVANHGTTFGSGGESCLRFNLATPRVRVEAAVTRMRRAFADLQ